MCIRIYVFYFHKKHTHKLRPRETKNNIKNEPKTNRRKKITLLWTVFLENLMGYDDIG